MGLGNSIYTEGEPDKTKCDYVWLIGKFALKINYYLEQYIVQLAEMERKVWSYSNYSIF